MNERRSDHGRPVRGEWALAPPLRAAVAQQRSNRGRHVVLPHQAFPDQITIRPDRGQAPQILGVADSALGHQKRSGGTSGASSSVVARSVFNVRKSRLLMPISEVSRPRARSSSRLSCTSTRTSMSRLRADELQVTRLAIGQAGHDQQDAIGAHRAAFVDLPGIEDEVLAQYRQSRRRRERRADAPGALKIFLVSQHRQAGSATILDRRGPGRRIEIGPNQPARMARPS